MMKCWRFNWSNRPTFADLERDVRDVIRAIEEQPDPNEPVASEIYVPASTHAASLSSTTNSDSEMQLLLHNDLSEESGPSLLTFEVDERSASCKNPILP